MKIATSRTKEGLIQLINEYYFSTNCIINEGNTVLNIKLNKVLGEVKQCKKRFIYYAN